MEALFRVTDFEQIKLLADPRRLAILRRLMAGSETISTLGQALDEHPARIRHHLKQLEDSGLVELVEVRPTGGYVEKYYRARARAFVLNELILPFAPQAAQTLVALGSHDLALERLGAFIQPHTPLLTVPLGSLDGLIALRQGRAHLAGCHLLDVESAEYNLPFIRRLFPDREIALFTLAHRVQGLLLAPGNPHGIASLADVERSGLRLINRNRGSGTRLWLDVELARLGVDGRRIAGYADEARTHLAVAETVAAGQADLGLGLQAAAVALGLDFIPLFQERFDLAVPAELMGQPLLQPLLNGLQSTAFRREVDSMPGYDTHALGDRQV